MLSGLKTPKHSSSGLRALALLAGCLLASCASSPKSEVVVSVKDQKLGLYSEGKLVKKYTISTSKFGLGDRPGSNCTPLGKHEIVAKIGHGLPPGAVLKSRNWNGEVLKPNAAGRDPIVSRILWLKGLEKDNRNAYKRFIYIHGTPEEKNLGQPASYGCIRMGMKDVVSVFNDVGIGAKVVITKGGLPQGKKGSDVEGELEAGAIDAAAIASADTAGKETPAGAGAATLAPAPSTKDGKKTEAALVKDEAEQDTAAKVARTKKEPGKTSRMSAAAFKLILGRGKEHS